MGRRSPMHISWIAQREERKRGQSQCAGAQLLGLHRAHDLRRNQPFSRRRTTRIGTARNQTEFFRSPAEAQQEVGTSESQRRTGAPSTEGGTMCTSHCITGAAASANTKILVQGATALGAALPRKDTACST